MSELTPAQKSEKRKLLIKHGSVYEVAAFIREEYDDMPEEILEPLLFRLLDQLLPEPEEVDFKSNQPAVKTITQKLNERAPIPGSHRSEVVARCSNAYARPARRLRTEYEIAIDGNFRDPIIGVGDTVGKAWMDAFVTVSRPHLDNCPSTLANAECTCPRRYPDAKSVDNNLNDARGPIR